MWSSVTCVIGLLLLPAVVYAQPAVIGILNPPSTVSENVGTVTLNVGVSSGGILAGSSVRIGYQTIPGSAVSGGDYGRVSGILLLTDENPTQSVSINIVNDAIVEGSEVFSFFIFNFDNTAGITENPGTVIITIADDDSAPTGVVIGFQPSSYDITEGGNDMVCVQIMNNIQLTRQVVFNFATSDGSAQANLDYVPLSADLAYGPINDDQVMCLTIQTIQDGAVEGTEVFTVGLSTNDADVTFNPSTATVRILDDDSPDPCDNNPCDVNAVCDSTRSPICTCNANYMGDGFTCQLITMGGGDDPHFSIVLPSGKLLCFTVQGEHGFAFNLISTDRVHINALFVPDSVRDEVTWMGALGIVVDGERYHGNNKTRLRFDAKTKTVKVGNEIVLSAAEVGALQFKNGKLIISEKSDEEIEDKEHPSVCVNLEDVGLHFHVRFFGEHLDIFWNSVTIDNEGNKNVHGLIGQFYREGVKIDTVRKFLLLPKMEPVPVMRRPVWAFMERETRAQDDQLCWTAMNTGYQGEGLIQGTYLDYLVDDVLDDGFVYEGRL